MQGSRLGRWSLVVLVLEAAEVGARRRQEQQGDGLQSRIEGLGRGDSRRCRGRPRFTGKTQRAADLTELGEGIRHSGAGLERRPSATEWRSSNGDPGLMKISGEGRRLSPASADGGAACSEAESGGARSEGNQASGAGGELLRWRWSRPRLAPFGPWYCCLRQHTEAREEGDGVGVEAARAGERTGAAGVQIGHEEDGERGRGVGQAGLWWLARWGKREWEGVW